MALNEGLQGKVALVTGGARDIGQAVSLALAAAGAKVAVNTCHSVAAGEATVAKINAEGGTAMLVQGDMTVAADVQEFVSSAQRAFGRELHVLVNVTGGLVARRGLAEMDEAFLNEVMRLNLNSTFLATKHVVPHMPNGGAIVNCASQAGRDGGGPGAAAYASAKGAVMTFTRAMAKELGARNIRVNAVCPGMIDTTFHDMFTKDAVRASVAAGTALGREGQALEVGRLVAWLASQEASYVTGANIDVNGGAYFV